MGVGGSGLWGRVQEAHTLLALSQAHLPGFTVASTFKAPHSFQKLKNRFAADETWDPWARHSPPREVSSLCPQTWTSG